VIEMRVDDATRLLPELIREMSDRAARFRDSRNGPAPEADPIVFRRSAGRYRCGYFVAAPRDVPASGQFLVVVHGISRDAREQIEAFSKPALARGWTVVAPLFDAATFPGYQQLGYARCETRPRADLALIEVLADAGWTDSGSSRLCMFGYSGGAQFVHRFVLVHPDRVGAACLGAAGWYTFPNARKPFPRGLRMPAGGIGMPVQFEESLAVPCSVFVGALDRLRDESLNTSAKIDRDQGRNRVERACRWIDAMRAAAVQAGRHRNFHYEELPGCGHSFGECVEKADLASKAMAFFSRVIDAQC